MGRTNRPEEEKKRDSSRALADAGAPKFTGPSADSIAVDEFFRVRRIRTEKLDLKDPYEKIEFYLRKLETAGWDLNSDPEHARGYEHARSFVFRLMAAAIPEAKPAERSEAEQPSPSPQPKDSGALLPTHAVYPGPTEASVRVYWCGGFANIGTSFPECAKGLAAVVNSHAAYRKALEEAAELLEKLPYGAASEMARRARSALSETGEG